MKKEEAKKLSEVIKKLIKQEVNLAVQDIGKVMGKIIKEQVAKEFKKQKSIINEYNIVQQKQNEKNNNLRESFNREINYGYTLAKSIDNNKINISNYAPKTIEKKSIKTGNGVLDNVLKDVAENMPENFGNDNLNSIYNENSYNNLNLNNTSYNNQRNQFDFNEERPINFQLPMQDTEGGLLHLDDVNPDVINKLVKNYRPVIQKIEAKKPIAKQALNYKDINSVQINTTENN